MLTAFFASFTAHLDGLIASAQTALYVDVVQPLLFRFDLMDYDEDTYDALYWVIVGLVEIVVMFILLRPLEALRPIESWPHRRAVKVDVLYTWISRLGLINLVFFFALQPVFDSVQAWLRIKNLVNLNLDTLSPFMTRSPIFTFFLYLVLLDFAGYWVHRWQHRFAIWWELHAVHHSQQQLSLWSDDRNHVLDDLVLASLFALLALVFGVPPSQYVVLVAVTNLAQSLQHVNARVPFGWLLERVLISPAFHRRHHAIGYGHEGTHYGCNFGVLLPCWDMLFRTASWNRTLEPTGIRDQLPGADGQARSYGSGFWSQQWLALARIARLLRGGTVARRA